MDNGKPKASNKSRHMGPVTFYEEEVIRLSNRNDLFIQKSETLLSTRREGGPLSTNSIASAICVRAISLCIQDHHRNMID